MARRPPGGPGRGLRTDKDPHTIHLFGESYEGLFTVLIGGRSTGLHESRYSLNPYWPSSHPPCATSSLTSLRSVSRSLDGMCHTLTVFGQWLVAIRSLYGLYHTLTTHGRYLVAIWSASPPWSKTASRPSSLAAFSPSLPTSPRCS